MDKTQAKRTARLKANNAKKGLVQVSVWVPQKRRAELIRIAAEMRRTQQEIEG